MSEKEIRELYLLLRDRKPHATNTDLCTEIEKETSLDYTTIVNTLIDLPEYQKNTNSEPRKKGDDKFVDLGER